MARRAGLCLLAAALWVGTAVAAAAVPVGPQQVCKGPATKYDPIVLNSTLYGRPNRSDSVWHDDTWAFSRFGPISRLTLYKAWYYDGAWHDPGELKGVQAWHGRYFTTQEPRLLFGAKRPHVPLNCTLYRNEVFVGAQLEWDHIFRFMNFTTNLGRWCSWGFPNVENVTKAVAVAPGPNTYIAALRGYEGKPLPASMGGFKKRYIVQIGFAWAQRKCINITSNSSSSPVAAAAAGTMQAGSGSPANSAGVRQRTPSVPAPASQPVILPTTPLNTGSLQQLQQRTRQQQTQASQVPAVPAAALALRPAAVTAVAGTAAPAGKRNSTRASIGSTAAAAMLAPSAAAPSGLTAGGAGPPSPLTPPAVQ